jgi:hypothetical protein
MTWKRKIWFLLLLFAFATASLVGAGISQVRTYQLREPRDIGVLFAMAITPEQDVLSLIPKRNGTWRLTRVRGWLDREPVEQTIDIPGIEVPRQVSESGSRLTLLQMSLLVTTDGRFAISIANGVWHGSAGTSTSDDVVSVVDLDAFRVVKTPRGPTLSQEPAKGGNGAIRTREYALDHAGRLVVRTNTSLRSPTSYCDTATKRTVRVSTTEFEWNKSEIDLQLLTLPDLTNAGECHYREALHCGGNSRDDRSGACADMLRRTQGDSISLSDFLNVFSSFYELRLKDPLKHRCPTTGITRNGRFEKESCFGFPTRTFWGNPGKPSEYRENILSLKTGQQVGTINELGKESVLSQFADRDGRDYLIVIDSGTRLKIYLIAE